MISIALDIALKTRHALTRTHDRRRKISTEIPPLDFHLKGHAGQGIFIHIYNEKTSFRDF